MPASFSMMGAWRKAGAIMALASEKPRSVGNAERGFFFGCAQKSAGGGGGRVANGWLADKKAPADCFAGAFCCVKVGGVGVLAN